jgi:hypothetical protein
MMISEIRSDGCLRELSQLFPYTCDIAFQRQLRDMDYRPTGILCFAI